MEIATTFRATANATANIGTATVTAIGNATANATSPGVMEENTGRGSVGTETEIAMEDVEDVSTRTRLVGPVMMMIAATAKKIMGWPLAGDIVEDRETTKQASVRGEESSVMA